MLYDPKWEVETKPVDLTLTGLIAWLETKPSAGRYNWENCEGLCLIGLYGAAMGAGDKWGDFHSQLYDNDKLDIARLRPHTFGAALKRARRSL